MKYADIMIKEEAGRCLLCNEPACTTACSGKIDCGRVLRALRFENEIGAGKMFPEVLPCLKCEESPCLAACRRGKITTPVAIPDILEMIPKCLSKDQKKVDLSVDFCNVHCENPFFLSSSVVGNNYEMVAKAFDMGWAGVAFKTIGVLIPDEVSPRFSTIGKESTPFIGFKNIEQISDHTVEENLDYLKKLKKNYPSKVIIASIMGQNEEEWTYLAEAVERAGADIVECNFSCPHMAEEGLGSDVGTNPELVACYTRATRRGTKLPILAKMTPNITNIELPARAAIEAGADGIAAINTIKSVMNVHFDDFGSEPYVQGKSSIGGYSGKAVKPIALRCIQDIKKARGLENVPISGMGGIETWKDALEFIALGCQTVQVTTAVMQYGYRIIDDLLEGLSCWLSGREEQHIEELAGKALPNLVPADELERDTICYPKFDRSRCVSCQRCYLSCYDGGHQALTISEKTGQPVMDGKKCVGCHLCVNVCPVGAISPGTRVKK